MRFTFIILLLSLISCNNKDETAHYHQTHKLERSKCDSVTTVYYDTVNKGIYNKQFHFSQYDSIVYYYKNGNVFKYGKQDKNGRKFGNWKLFTKNKKLSEIVEYFIINGEDISNRYWFFNKEGDTAWSATNFNKYDQEEFAGDTLGERISTMNIFHVYTKDSINLNEPFLASVICNSPVGREYNSQIVMYLAKEDHNFNKDFSNTTTVKLDTFYNLVKDVKNRANFTYLGNPQDKYRYIVAFGKYFKKPGKKILRGYMLEHYNFIYEGDSALAERKIYFEKELFVRDTVK